MKNILLGITLAILVIGIVSLHFRYTRGCDGNWELANLPFPVPGLFVASAFHIENGGKFDLELNVPIY